MPRMFDMLRGKGDDKEDIKSKKEKAADRHYLDKEKEPSRAKPLNFPKEILKKSDKQQKKKTENHSLMSKKLISTVKKSGVDNQDAARGIYERAIETVKVLLEKIRNREDLNPFMDEVYALLDNVFNQLLLGDNLLNEIYNKIYEETENGYFLPCHIVNLLILSLYLGINMGFNKSRLKHLGLASIFCDVGYDAMREMVEQPRKLTNEEYEIMKSHVPKGLEVIEKVDAVSDIVKETIMMHHERINGSGYPRGLKSDEINPYAKIIGLVDTYEAMTHDRPYRDGMSAHKTMKFMINSLNNNFDHDAIKLLIDRMSIYPIGSIVRLDTEEVARVVSVKPGSPLRPVVMILKDAFGQPVKERIIIDLSKPDSPSIQSPL